MSPFLSNLGYRVETFEQYGVSGLVLRGAKQSTLKAAYSDPATHGQKPPHVAGVHADATAWQRHLSTTITHNEITYAIANSFAGSHGASNPFALARLGTGGFLTTPNDIMHVLGAYESKVRELEGRVKKLQATADLLDIAEVSVKAGGDVDVALRERGTKPEVFQGRTRNEAGFSTTKRKCQKARVVVNVLKAVLGGEAGFNTWLIFELERSVFGRSGLAQELRIFQNSILETILASKDLSGELKRLLDKRNRPTRATFALRLDTMRQGQISQLRALIPGFVPGTNQLAKEKKEILAATIAEFLPGGVEATPMVTELNEAGEREQRAAADAEAMGDAEQQTALAQVREAMDGGEDGTSGAGEFAGLDGELDDAIDDQLVLDKDGVRKGYGIKDMRDALQFGLLTLAPFDVNKPGSMSSTIVVKFTEDAGRFQQLSAHGINKATSGQLEFVSYGDVGAGIGQQLMHPSWRKVGTTCAQSSTCAIPVLKSLSGDGRDQV